MKKGTAILVGAFLIATSGVSNQTMAEQIPSQIKFGGDFRYRHEYVDQEKTDVINRHRIRTRLNMTANLEEGLTFGLQLGTGSDDPVSTNQTLTGGFSGKTVYIRNAYFDWNLPGINGLSLTGGKNKTPFISAENTELIWDNDLSPEGLVVSYTQKADFGDYFARASYYWLQKIGTEPDETLIGAQVGTNLKSSAVELLAGVGYYDYQNVKGHTLIYKATTSFGNSVNTTGKYLYDYNEVNITVVLKPVMLVKNTSIYADYVNNIAKDVKKNQGWLIGARFGECKNPGSYYIKYNYRYIEKDCIIGAFNFSDFVGGGTDGKGSIISAGYQMTPKTTLEGTFFINEKGIDNSVKYYRGQLDLNFKI